MGAKAKITKKLYYKLKRQLNTSKDDKRVMEKYGIGQTTTRAIRNSFDFESFLERTGRSVKSEEKKAVLTPQEQAQRAWIGFSMLCVLAVFAAAFIITRWILSWFGI